jgi:hypothetical protein
MICTLGDAVDMIDENLPESLRLAQCGSRRTPQSHVVTVYEIAVALGVSHLDLLWPTRRTAK